MTLFSTRPHTLGVTYLEHVHADLGKFMLEYDEEFVWLDEILEACKKTLVSSEIQLLPKTPSSKKTRHRVIKKPEIKESSDSDADDEEATPPSHKIRQTRQKTKYKATTKNTRQTRGKKQNNESIETPRDKVSPNAKSTNLSKMSDCSELELSESEMTPVQKPGKKSLDKTPVNERTPVNAPNPQPTRAVKCSVKDRASAYENMLKRTSNSPNVVKVTPVNNESYSSFNETPELQNTVKQNKTASCIEHIKDKNLNGSFIKESPAQKRRSSRKSLKVLSSKIKRLSSHNHHFTRPVETYSSEEIEENIYKSEVISSNKEYSETDNDAVPTYQSPSKSLLPPVPKPRTPKSSKSLVITSDHEQSETTDKCSPFGNEVPMVVKSTDECDNVKNNRSISQKYSPNRDRDSGISGVMSTQSSSVSLKNLEMTDSERSLNNGEKRSRNLQSSPILEASDSDEMLIDVTESKTNRKRHVDECEEVSPAPKCKRSCIGLSMSENDPITPEKSVNDSVESDQYESMENESDDYTSPKCPLNKVIRLSRLQNSINRPNRPSNLMSGFVSSFIKRNTPVKTAKMTIDQKRKEVLEKEKRNEDRVQKKKDMLNRQMQERKRLREERMKKAAELRLEHERSDRYKKNENVKKMEERLNIKDRLKEEKLREERLLKQYIRNQKQKEAEERRKQDEEERLRKKDEQEEDDRRQKEFLQKKKEAEEQERQRKLAEEKQRQEERLAEAARGKQLESERLLQFELEREKENQRLKEEREKQLAKEKADREKLEFEKKREREAQIQKELIKLREMEKARLAKLTAEKEEQQKEKERLQRLAEKNQTASVKPLLNTTHNMSVDQNKHNPHSYDITPAKKTKDNSSNHDYNINDLHSDDSTDDEDAPRKKIPMWAQGTNLKAALINQEYHPPKLDEIFAVVPDLDLNDVFIKRKPRFNKRTSSAVWDSPLLKPCHSAQFHI